MRDAFDKTKTFIIVWKIFLIRSVLYSIVCLGSAWMTATSGLDVGSLPFWDKVTLVVGIFVGWGTLMIALLDTTAQKINAGQLPIEEQTTTQGPK